MPEVKHEFSILAPVPKEHLISGLEVAATQPLVAFGSGKWEFFGELDARRGGDPVPVLIYASDDDTPKTNNAVTWFGWYDGHVHSKGGAHPSGMTFRPQSTLKYQADNKGHWAVFWHVRGLRQLTPEKHVPIQKLISINGRKRSNAAPHGPELVVLPEILSYET